MRLINPSYEILEQDAGLQGVFEQIERAGKTCYKSQIKGGEGAKDFVDRMIANQHYAMLEHGTIYLSMPTDSSSIGKFYHMGTILASQFEANPHSVVKYSEDDVAHVTTNLRVLLEYFNEDIDFILDKYLCEPTEFHERRVSVRFYTDIGITRELNRHRVNSIAEQSTRYCNYSKDKFDNQLTICTNSDIPEELANNKLDKWNYPIKEGGERSQFLCMCQALSNEEFNLFGTVDTWLFANLASEWSYLHLLELGWLPQQARRVLPLDLHSEIVHTAFVSDWIHFLDLRALDKTGPAHPDMKLLAVPLYNEFLSRGFIEKE